MSHRRDNQPSQCEHQQGEPRSLDLGLATSKMGVEYNNALLYILP